MCESAASLLQTMRDASLNPTIVRIAADTAFAEQCLQWLQGASESHPWSSDQDGSKPCSPRHPHPTRQDFATALLNALRDAADALMPATTPTLVPSATQSELRLSSDHDFPSLGGSRRTTPSNDSIQPNPAKPAPNDQARPKNSKPKRKIQPSRVADVRKDATFTDAAVQRAPPSTIAQPRVRRNTTLVYVSLYTR